MRSGIIDKCDLLSANREVLKKNFKWDNDYMAFAAATMFTAASKMVDVSQLKSCEVILKEKAGVFSDFRGIAKLTILCKMAMSNDPEAYLNKVMEIHSYIEQGKFTGNNYRIVAATIIASHIGNRDFEPYVSRMTEIYKRMASNHSILTSVEDIPMAAMLAVTDKDIDLMVEDMEKCYLLIKKNFFSKNSVQSLTHVLSVNDDFAERKSEKAMMIFKELKSKKHEFGTGMELALLGALTFIDMTPSQIVDHVCEADDYLKKLPGFGSFFGIGSTSRRLIAAQVVISAYNSINMESKAVADNISVTSAIVETVLMLSAINQQAASDAAIIATM